MYPGPMEVIIGCAFLVLLAFVIAKALGGGQFELTRGRPLFPSSDMQKSLLPAKHHRSGTPAWFLPAGMIATITGILGFFASAAVGGRGDPLGGILAGLLNPLFFVGLPLGVYWLYCHGTRAKAIAGPHHRPDRQAENNPRLTHCPDCGGHVSRLAVACPHCGRPLQPEA